MTSTVKDVESDPARLLAVAVYVPAYDTPVMPGLVSVELALGALRSLLVMTTPPTPSIKGIEEFWTQVISLSPRLKSEKDAVKTKSSPPQK